jgi:hypothetical protein
MNTNKENYGFESKGAFMVSTSQMVFDLTNQTPNNLMGLFFHSLETGKTYMFTALGDGSYCLVSDNGTAYSRPVSYPSNKRLTALFVSELFSTNNIIDYWKFVIKNKNPVRTSLLMLNLQSVQYEF